jgi:hypothetical protein
MQEVLMPVQLLDRRAVDASGNPLVSVYGIAGTAPAMATDTHVISGIRIFRAGSFSDSMGVRSEWTVEDLDAMVANFTKLRSNGILPNVPVRADHSRSINSVVGYFTNLYREGDYLLADMELTEPDAVGKYQRGTYRSRSAEIGVYVTNDEQVYWPTVLGLAFCDIPAVEGLHAAALSAFSAAQVPATALVEVSPAPDSNSLSGIEAALVAAFSALKANPENSDTRAFAGRIVDAAKSFLDDSNASGSAPAGANAQTGSGGASTDSGKPEEGQVPTIKFTLGDDSIEVDETLKPSLEKFTANFAAVVAERDAAKAENATLQGQLVEAEYTRRDAAVDAWLKDGKIVPAQLDAQKTFCRTLSDEQFTAHSANIDALPQVSIAASKATTSTHSGSEGTEKAEKIAQYRATVRMLFASGTARDVVLKSKAAKALEALGETVEE